MKTEIVNTKDFKIIIIGLGSIGLRHYKNLRALGERDITVYDTDPVWRLKEIDAPALETFDVTTLRGFDIALICTPTHDHIRAALLAAEAGCHLFIEKPLAHTLEGLDQLEALCKEKGLITMVGCNYRFDKGFQKIESYLVAGAFGTALSARGIIGRDVPIADRARTEGVLLDSGAHAFEYLTALFGEIEESVGFCSNDFVSLVLRHNRGIVSNLTLDFSSRPKRHTLEVQCTEGFLCWDFRNHMVVSWKNGTQEMKTERVYGDITEEERRNVMYKDEMAYFLRRVEEGSREMLQDVARGKRILGMLLQAKERTVKL